MKKTWKKIITLLLSVALGISGGIAPGVSTQAAKTLKLKNVSGTVKTMYVGSVFSLKTNASSKQIIEYKSQKRSVAKVSSDGVVTAKKTGKAKIVIKNKTTGKKITLTVKVKKSPYFSVNKKSGTYSNALRIKIKAKKGYQVFYTTGKKFSKSKVIPSKKTKTITISKNTTLSVFAVKNKKSISLKKMKKKCGISIYSAKYTYTVSDTETSSDTAADTSSDAEATVAATPEATVNPSADATDSSVTTVNTATAFTEEETNPEDDPDELSVDATITLSESGWSATDTTNLKIKESDSVDNEQTSDSYTISTCTINAAGTYLFSGEGATGNSYQIKVKKAVTGVTLVFNGISISNTYTAPVLSNKNTNTTILLAKDSTNTVTGPEEFTDLVADDDGTSYESDTGSAIHGKGYDDEQSSLLITGSGSLTVQCDGGDGIQSKGALRIGNGEITVTAGNDGLQGKDELAIAGGTISVTTENDAMKATNDSDGIEYGYIDISGGEIVIDAKGDGIQAVSTLYIHESPEIAITTSADSDATSDDSMKGMKVSGYTDTSDDSSDSSYVYGLLEIAGGEISIDTTDTGSSNSKNSEDTGDDAIHSDSDIEITAGSITIAAADDAIHADGKLFIRDGQITVNSSYEGLESAIMYLDGGEITITAEDDGINVAGGDSSTDSTDPWQTNPGSVRPGSSDSSSSDSTSTEDEYVLYINGGIIIVRSEGDGLDSNGDIFMNDGEVYSYCTSSGSDAAIDYEEDAVFQLNGGTLLAVGPSDMAVGPDSSSTQYCLVASLSGSQSSLFHIEDSSGENILTVQPQSSYSHVIYSDPELAIGSSYAVYTGGSASGTKTDYDVYEDGVVYTKGTLLGNITLSSYQSTLSSGFYR